MACPRKFTKELTAEELSLLQGISLSRTEELRRYAPYRSSGDFLK